MTKTALRSVLLRVLFAAVTAVLGAFIGSRVEPTWRALVEGEEYRIRGKLARQDVGTGWALEAIPDPPRTGPANPAWAWGGGALGLGLGVVGRRWRFHGRVIPLLLGTLLGIVVGGLFGLTSQTRVYADRILTGMTLGGAIGLATTWVAYPNRRPDPAREQPKAVPAA